MASSPEMEPPGFEIPGPPPPPPPPPSESPPSQIDSFHSTSPDAAPPGFDKPNAWMLPSGNDASDPPPSQIQPCSSELPPLDTNPIGNCRTVGPPVKVEILDPAMLVPPPPPETESEEQNYRPVPKPETAPQGNEALFECHSHSAHVSQLAVHESVSESLGLPPSPPPLPLLSEAIVPESGYESLNPLPLLPLPLPPPALTLHDMPISMVLESKYDNFNQNTCRKGPTGDEIPSEHETVTPAQLPLAPQELGILQPAPPPPPSPPPQFKSESGIPSVPEMTEMKFDNHKMLQPLEQETLDPPNQEMETFSFPHRDGIPDMLSSETGPHVNKFTNEPPLKKSLNMHKMQGQLTPEACRLEIDKDRLVSETPAMSPHREEDMEALQIDMDMSEDDTLDRSPTYVGPPGSHTKESNSLEEAPPGYDTIDSNSQMEMISQDALSGMGQMVCGSCHELISYPRGALHVLCTCCQAINLVLEACQVGNIICGQCSVLLMYPFGAPSVRCSCCRYVTEIGAHNMRPPLSIQQGEGYPT